MRETPPDLVACFERLLDGTLTGEEWEWADAELLRLALAALRHSPSLRLMLMELGEDPDAAEDGLAQDLMVWVANGGGERLDELRARRGSPARVHGYLQARLVAQVRERFLAKTGPGGHYQRCRRLVDRTVAQTPGVVPEHALHPGQRRPWVKLRLAHRHPDEAMPARLDQDEAAALLREEDPCPAPDTPPRELAPAWMPGLLRLLERYGPLWAPDVAGVLTRLVPGALRRSDSALEEGERGLAAPGPRRPPGEAVEEALDAARADRFLERFEQTLPGKAAEALAALRRCPQDAEAAAARLGLAKSAFYERVQRVRERCLVWEPAEERSLLGLALDGVLPRKYRARTR